MAACYRTGFVAVGTVRKVSNITGGALRKGERLKDGLWPEPGWDMVREPGSAEGGGRSDSGQ